MYKWLLYFIIFLGFLGAVVWETSKLKKIMGAEDYLELGIEKGNLGKKTGKGFYDYKK